MTQEESKVSLSLIMRNQEAKEANEIFQYLNNKYGHTKWSQVLRYLFKKFYREEILNEEE